MKRLVLAAAAVVALAGAMPAAAHGPDPALDGGAMTQGLLLEYRWDPDGAPPLDMRYAIHDARNDANASHKSKAGGFDYDVDAPNEIYYGTSVPCGVNGLACFTRSTPASFGMWFRENGHRFDWGTLRWCELSGSPDGCFDAENVALDEFGHVLGLAHHANYADDGDFKDAVVQTVSRAKPKAGYNAHVFGRCDVAALQQLYDVASYTTLYSTCGDVPTYLTLSASAASVVSGSMVTFTAALRSDGDGRLSNNPMNGRTVVLQQRTSSGWSDVLTMGAGSANGSYVTSLTVRASTDYRALFRKPSNEGVQADSSPTVAITASAGCSGPCPQFVAPGR